MKNKLIAPFLLIFGLFAGTASAVVLDPLNGEILTLGDGITSSGVPGVETDGFEQSTPTLVANTGDFNVDFWVGLDVINNVTTFTTSEGADDAGSDLGFELSYQIGEALGGFAGEIGFFDDTGRDADRVEAVAAARATYAVGDATEQLGLLAAKQLVAGGIE